VRIPQRPINYINLAHPRDVSKKDAVHAAHREKPKPHNPVPSAAPTAPTLLRPPPAALTKRRTLEERANLISLGTESLDSLCAAVAEDGKLFTWGNVSSGALGHGSRDRASKPTEVKGALDGKRVKSVACGAYQTLALTDDGQLFEWGATFSTYEEKSGGRSIRVLSCLFYKCDNDKLEPTLVRGFLTGLRVKRVAAGKYHALAVVEDGRLFSWGYGGMGALGHGNTVNEPLPRQVQGVVAAKRVVEVAGGDQISLALAEDGTVFSWGKQYWGREFSTTQDDSKPNEVSGLTGTAVACGGCHNLVLTEAGAIFAWGANQRGQLGLGHTNTNHSNRPVGVRGKLAHKRVEVVAAGHLTSAAVTDDGCVYTWGNERSLPTLKLGMLAEPQLACGCDRMAIVSVTGTLMEWNTSTIAYSQEARDVNGMPRMFVGPTASTRKGDGAGRRSAGEVDENECPACQETFLS